jgi:hypothetical protein
MSTIAAVKQCWGQGVTDRTIGSVRLWPCRSERQSRREGVEHDKKPEALTAVVLPRYHIDINTHVRSGPSSGRGSNARLALKLQPKF